MTPLDRATVLVTGAGGFLGQAVVRALAGRAGRLRALLGPPGGAFDEGPAGVECARAQIDDEQAVAELVRGAAVVVHLAGPPSVAASFEAPAEYARVHVTGTATVLAACARAGVERVVYVSSAEVYGAPRALPVGEDHPLAARSPYAAAKIGAEALVDGFTRARGGQAVVLRPFSLYGPGQPPASLLASLLRQALAGGPVEVADLRPARDYCFVEDAAAAVARACVAGDGTFNVGTGRATSVAALARLVMAATGRDDEVREVPGRRRPERVEITCLVADPGRARSGLGWSAVTPLACGIERTVAALRAGGGRPCDGGC